MQGVADALARAGHESPARALFICALLLLFAPCAWRLTNAHAARRERVSVSLVLGLGLFASYVMHQPLQLDSFDELIHVGTLVQLLDSHAAVPDQFDPAGQPLLPRARTGHRRHEVVHRSPIGGRRAGRARRRPCRPRARRLPRRRACLPLVACGRHRRARLRGESTVLRVRCPVRLRDDRPRLRRGGGVSPLCLDRYPSTQNREIVRARARLRRGGGRQSPCHGLVHRRHSSSCGPQGCISRPTLSVPSDVASPGPRCRRFAAASLRGGGPADGPVVLGTGE